MGPEERAYLTGFSGGGNLAWWMTLRHPDLLAGVVPVCPNHAFWCVSGSDAKPGRRSAPILVLSGEKDALRHSRISLPMPPLGLTLIVALVLGVGAGWVTWRRWRRARWVFAVELFLILLSVALLQGRISGNGFQTAVAVDMVKQLGHPAEWKHEPDMWHDPAPDKVFRTISQWRRQTSD